MIQMMSKNVLIVTEKDSDLKCEDLVLDLYNRCNTIATNVMVKVKYKLLRVTCAVVINKNELLMNYSCSSKKVPQTVTKNILKMLLTNK